MAAPADRNQTRLPLVLRLDSPPAAQPASDKGHLSPSISDGLLVIIGIGEGSDPALRPPAQWRAYAVGSHLGIGQIRQ